MVFNDWFFAANFCLKGYFAWVEENKNIQFYLI